MESEPPSLFLFLLFILLLPCISSAGTESGDAVALLALKSAVDRHDSLPWRREAAAGMCGRWSGVKGCSPGGRVTKLVLEFLNLTGTLEAELLAPLDQLRVLSLKSNALYGGIPNLSPLFNLKSLYLGGNRFSGRIPVSLAGLHRLKIVAFEGNRLSGPIPASFANIPRLYMLLLQDNTLSGFIPAFNQQGLRYFNVSGNGLSGEIPATRALAQFNASSFLNNPELCGTQVEKPCSDNLILPPSAGSKHAPSPVADFVIPPAPVSTRRKSKRVVRIVAGAVAGGVFLLICLLLAVLLFCRRKMKTFEENGPRSVAKSAGAEVSSSETGGGGGVKGWEGEEGRLEFCGGAGEMYGLEELLRASAETMGRGTVGSTYKAVMETGFIVTVKRLREAAPPCAAEFRRRMEELGRLRHPNLVPLRAYFQAKEERLLVFDYFPNGSLFSLIHGSRHSSSGKPLHWTSCLKIVEDVATGLLYLHQSGTIHGNLKSSNVLLGSDFESCLTDYSLIPYLHCTTDESNSSSSTTTTHPALFYRAPESRHPQKPAFTPRSDVYSFGVLLLELLTGKTPFHDLVERHCADIPRWVRSVREEESIDDPTSGNETSSSSEEKLAALIGIATTCVSATVEGRPTAKEVLRMIREARAEALVSSNSSDHSPGRWSDTVQSLPREYGSEHLNFAERD